MDAGDDRRDETHAHHGEHQAGGVTAPRERQHEGGSGWDDNGPAWQGHRIGRRAPEPTLACRKAVLPSVLDHADHAVRA
jgi:hypothetical protein